MKLMAESYRKIERMKDKKLGVNICYIELEKNHKNTKFRVKSVYFFRNVLNNELRNNCQFYFLL